MPIDTEKNVEDDRDDDAVEKVVEDAFFFDEKGERFQSAA